MIRNLTLATGLLALSALAFAPNAFAQTAVIERVPFNGVIPSFCTFSATAAGNLAVPGTLQAVEGSDGIPGGFGTGTAGATTVNCSQGGMLSTGIPAVVAAPAGWAPTILQSVVYNPNANAGAGVYTTKSNGAFFDTGTWTRATADLTIPVNVNTLLQVGMIAGEGQGVLGAVPAGNYSYTVTLTALPN